MMALLQCPQFRIIAVHTLYMNSQKQVLSYAKKAKFDLVEVIDMKKCDFKYHYLYVLQKNN